MGKRASGASLRAAKDSRGGAVEADGNLRFGSHAKDDRGKVGTVDSGGVRKTKELKPPHQRHAVGSHHIRPYSSRNETGRNRKTPITLFTVAIQDIAGRAPSRAQSRTTQGRVPDSWWESSLHSEDKGLGGGHKKQEWLPDDLLRSVRDGLLVGLHNQLIGCVPGCSGPGRSGAGMGWRMEEIARTGPRLTRSMVRARSAAVAGPEVKASCGHHRRSGPPRPRLEQITGVPVEKASAAALPNVS